MDCKRRHKGSVLALLFLIIQCCTKGPERTCVDIFNKVLVTVNTVKSISPDPVQICDLNLLLYNTHGALEERRYIDERKWDGSPLSFTLLKDCRYTLFAAANLGYGLPAISLEEAFEYRFHLAYPDELSHGIPMSTVMEFTASESGINLFLERLMAKIDVDFDYSGLESGVKIAPESIEIGNCPSWALLFRKGEYNGDRTFSDGYSKSGSELSSLPVSLFMLEGGESFLEIKCSYTSPSYRTAPGQYLIYRCSLGKIERNTTRKITIAPAGNGLSGDGWRLDRSGLEPVKSFSLYPAAYNECRIGESYRIWCDVTPFDTPLEIEVLAYDDDTSLQDVFDYTIDPQGHGITIRTKKGGTAVIYFRAGPPVQRDTLAMLVVG